MSGRQALLQRRQIDERLERRAGLALGRDRAVELAVGVIASADHRLDRARGIERHQRPLLDAELGALRVELVGQRPLGLSLHLGIDRGRHHDVVVDRADRVVERVHDIVGDVVDRACALVVDHLRRVGERRLGHRLGDVALLGHRGDDLGGALVGALEVAVGREPGRRLHQPGEQRGFRQGHEARALAEIFLRRRLDPIGARAEVDAVEIEFEDLILRIPALEPQRQDRLLDLARQRALLGQEQVLRQLLGQRRAALDAAPADHVAHEGARDAEGIDADMVVEPPVLDRHESLRQIGRQVDQPDGGAAGVAAIGDERAVVGQDGDVRRPLGHRELIDRRQLARVVDDERNRRDHAPHREHGAPVDEAAKPGAASPAGPRGRSRRGFLAPATGSAGGRRGRREDRRRRSRRAN